MKNDLLIQYGAIRQTVRTNVDTIRSLLAQAESLKVIVEKLSDGKEKTSLEYEARKIEETIGVLVMQTSELFNKYETFVETVFK